MSCLPNGYSAALTFAMTLPATEERRRPTQCFPNFLYRISLANFRIWTFFEQVIFSEIHNGETNVFGVRKIRSPHFLKQISKLAEVLRSTRPTSPLFCLLEFTRRLLPTGSELICARISQRLHGDALFRQVTLDGSALREVIVGGQFSALELQFEFGFRQHF